MNKYNFGYELQEGTTNKWAYDQIEPRTSVLELGAAVGGLTYNLYNKKGCKVDIVELDSEAGQQAKEYANYAIIGEKLGDLNDVNWFSEIADNRYDYIVCLDVLEHLKDPEKTLRLAMSLLNEKGKILLSIPNVAHNAVILHLCKNNFEYIDLGLLDNTHIHFFAYENIIKMLKKIGLYIYVLDGIKKHISETEFENILKGFPIDVEKYFRTRNKGDVYQFLLVVGPKKEKTNNMLDMGISLSSLYESKVLVDGLSKNEKSFAVIPDEINIEVDLAEYQKAERIVFFPLEQDVVVTGLKIVREDKQGKQFQIYSNWTMGEKLDDETYWLHNGNYGINIKIPKNTIKVRITCECRLIDETIGKILQKAIVKKGFLKINKNRAKRITKIERR